MTPPTKSSPTPLPQIGDVSRFESLEATGVDPAASIRSVYVHIPFCFHKCHYCDFYSIVDSKNRQEAFAIRMVDEISASRQWLTKPLESIFVGGGTPTLLKSHLWERLLDAMHRSWQITRGTEFTVEANPETVSDRLSQVLFQGGVNRASIGAQTFNSTHLKTLERWHDPRSVGRAVESLRSAGISSINLDLIFGIPGQSLADWKLDINQALDLEPTHLSCYGLMYEPNTPLTVKMNQGSVVPVDEDVEASMYEHTTQSLKAAGFDQYEISNWTMPGRHCRHNLAYWRNENWLAVGPSASGHIAGLRWKNVPRLSEYLNSQGMSPVQDVEQLDDSGRAGECIMLGLRLNAGIPLDQFDALLKCGAGSIAKQEAAHRHERNGLLERTSTHVRLSERGRMLADSVLTDLI